MLMSASSRLQGLSPMKVDEVTKNGSIFTAKFCSRSRWACPSGAQCPDDVVGELTVSIFLAWVFREVLRYVGYTSRSSGVQWDGE